MAFFKYRSLFGDSRSYTEDIILNSRLFFAKPIDFNDPFEFQADILLDATREEFTKYMEICGFDNMALLKSFSEEQFNEYVKPLLRGRDKLGWGHVINKLKSAYGVLCLSRTPTNINMWSNYGDNHRGVCFEFESLSDADCFHHAERVVYNDNPPKINIVKSYIDENERRNISRQFVYNKYSHAWDHEEEWRILKKLTDGDMELTDFPRDSLKAIYLGCQYRLDDPFTQVIKQHRPDVDVILLKKDNTYTLSEKFRCKPDKII